MKTTSIYILKEVNSSYESQWFNELVFDFLAKEYPPLTKNSRVYS